MKNLSAAPNATRKLRKHELAIIEDEVQATIFICKEFTNKGQGKKNLTASVARKFKSICRKLALFVFALPSSTCKLAS